MVCLQDRFPGDRGDWDGYNDQAPSSLEVLRRQSTGVAHHEHIDSGLHGHWMIRELLDHHIHRVRWSEVPTECSCRTGASGSSGGSPQLLGNGGALS